MPYVKLKGYVSKFIGGIMFGKRNAINGGEVDFSNGIGKHTMKEVICITIKVELRSKPLAKLLFVHITTFEGVSKQM